MKNNYSQFYKQWWKERRKPSGDSYYMECEHCEKKVWERDVWAGNFSHIKSKGAYPELALEPSNLEFLCYPCHQKEHGFN